MHALGFDHTHTRSVQIFYAKHKYLFAFSTDRDEYVEIDFNNIKEKEQHNFHKVSIPSYWVNERLS